MDKKCSSFTDQNYTGEKAIKNLQLVAVHHNSSEINILWYEGSHPSITNITKCCLNLVIEQKALHNSMRPSRQIRIISRIRRLNFKSFS